MARGRLVVRHLLLGALKARAADEPDDAGLGDEARERVGELADLRDVRDEVLDVVALEVAVQHDELDALVLGGSLVDGLGVLRARGEDDGAAVVDEVLDGVLPVVLVDMLRVGVLPLVRLGSADQGVVAALAPAAVIDGAVDEHARLVGALLGAGGKRQGQRGGAGGGHRAADHVSAADRMCVHVNHLSTMKKPFTNQFVEPADPCPQQGNQRWE